MVMCYDLLPFVMLEYMATIGFQLVLLLGALLAMKLRMVMWIMKCYQSLHRGGWVSVWSGWSLNFGQNIPLIYYNTRLSESWFYHHTFKWNLQFSAIFCGVPNYYIFLFFIVQKTFYCELSYEKRVKSLVRFLSGDIFWVLTLEWKLQWLLVKFLKAPVF